MNTSESEHQEVVHRNFLDQWMPLYLRMGKPVPKGWKSHKELVDALRQYHSDVNEGKNTTKDPKMLSDLLYMAGLMAEDSKCNALTVTGAMETAVVNFSLENEDIYDRMEPLKNIIGHLRTQVNGHVPITILKHCECSPKTDLPPAKE